MFRSIAVRSILLVLCAQALFTVAESTTVLEMYSAVFENTGQSLDESAVYRHVMSLHGTSLAKEMKDRVEYIYGLLTDNNIGHCNVEYLDGVRRQFELIRKPIDGNLKTLFGLVHQNLVKVCSAQHMNIAANLNKKFNTYQSYDLLNLRKYYFQWQQSKMTDDELLQKIMEMIEADRDDKIADIRAAWNKSACVKVNSIMKQPKMKSFYDFAFLNSYFAVEAAYNCPEAIRDWALNVPMCEALDKWMQKTITKAGRHPSRWFEY